MHRALYFFSFLIVAFGQPSVSSLLSLAAATFGFALFWKSIANVKRPFVSSLVWFAAVQAVQLSWMTSLKYMGPFILVVYLFLSLAMGAQFALLTMLPKNRLTALAGAWTLLEWLRLFFMCGFTWNPVGLAMAGSIYSMQWASLFGVYGLSFWVILVNAAVLRAMERKTRKSVCSALLLAFLPFCFGFLQMHRPQDDHGVLRAGLIQTALYPGQKEPLTESNEIYVPPVAQWERIVSLVKGHMDLDLLVLPEAALPVGARTPYYSLNMAKNFFGEEALVSQKQPVVHNLFLASTLANWTSAHVVAGIDDRDALGHYNAAFHFRPQNSGYERYEKRVLVPVGEYIPFTGLRIFSEFIGEQFGIYNSFDPGASAKVFQAKVPLGVSICMEETFSSLMRESKQLGAKAFVNLTNDGWFPDSSLPKQHFEHGRLRAVENGIPLLRACNTGVTCWVDSFGRLGESLELEENQPGILIADVSVKTHSTLYSLVGDLAIVLMSALCVFWPQRLRINIAVKESDRLSS